MRQSIPDTKADLRQIMRGKLRMIKPEARTEASMSICNLIKGSTIWENSRSVMLFSPIREEPDIWPLASEALLKGKLLALPRYVPNAEAYQAAVVDNLASGLIRGRYGIIEPTPELPAVHLNQLDLVIVPGVAFDPLGHRLGRGKGYYDRLLRQTVSIRVGVAYDEQILAELPVDAHDEILNLIVTPTRWLSNCVTGTL